MAQGEIWRDRLILLSSNKRGNPAKEQPMKVSAILLSAALLCGTSAMVMAQSDGTAAKQDMKSAGHDTADAGKDVGHGVKHGAKATGHGIKKGAKATKHGAKKVGHDIAHPNEPGPTQ